MPRVTGEHVAAADTRRRLVAVLHADIQGYTLRTEEDEIAAARAIAEYQTIFVEHIESHDGRTVDIAGDSVLAEFSSTIDALNCAMAVQGELGRRNQPLPPDRRMQYRIGIHAGEAVVLGDRIYGDVVNVAARVQQNALSGGICISGMVREIIADKLPLDCELLDDGRVRNRAKPVKTYRVHLRANSTARRQRALSGDDIPLESRPSVAVLAFQNRSDDVNQQYFSDGFSDDIITNLSYFRNLSVLARQTVFRYRDPDLDLRRLGRELGVKYVVRGSVRRMGPRVRITAALIDCDTEHQVWGEHFDEDAEALFGVQDQIVSRIATTAEYRLSEERLSRTRRVPPNTLEAFDWWLQGNELMYRWEEQSDLRAMELYEQAIELDPGFARAYASLAAIYNSKNIQAPGNPDDKQDRVKALELGQRAVDLDPADARNHVYHAWGHMLARDFKSAEHHFDCAGTLNPNDATVLIARAQAYAYLGRTDEALACADRALLLNPLPLDYYFAYLASIYFLAGDYEKTIETADRVPQVLLETGAWQSAAHAHLGRMAEARSVATRFVEDVLARWVGSPDAGAADVVAWLDQITMLRRRRDREHLFGGLEKAGLPPPPEIRGP